MATAQHLLLELESADPRSATRAERWDELFRAFHTLKGLAGMVGLRGAEQVAHRLEAYLSGVRKGNHELTPAGIDSLLEGVAYLRSATDAVRGNAYPPDASPVLTSLNAGLSTAAGSPSTSPPPAAEIARPNPTDKAKAAIEAAHANGRPIWRVEFVPSKELAERGVNVTTVRARLSQFGDIVHAEPMPLGAGGIAFRFYVAGQPESEKEPPAEDGLKVELVLPEAEPAREQAVASPRAFSNVVRVDLARLDDLMRMVGDLVLSRAKLENGLARVADRLPTSERRRLEEVVHGFDRQLRDLREAVMRTRMVAVRELFARMRLVVRDLTRDSGKAIDLVTVGDETEIDKYLVERMAEPLLHLVRNAVSHGIETSAERATAGKQPRGRIELRASAAAGIVSLEIKDDGQGIAAEAVLAKARQQGLITESAGLDAGTVLDLLCTPGFSTRDEADRGSERGVGMDSVRRTVEDLGGRLALDYRAGEGTRFVVQLPLTLVIADVLTVQVAGQTFAIAQSAVREVIPVDPATVTRLENNELIRHQGKALPLVQLCDVFGSPRPSGAFVALVVGEGPAAVAFGADRALGLREVVVRPLSDPLVQVPGLGGATEMGEGRPILILDPSGLLRLSRRRVLQPSAVRG
ncbi:MAG: chemotaxis protein CheA [Gemmataceae bacterium]|nr:chemotaxis protein CheA [Gemmataceae bacterium]